MLDKFKYTDKEFNELIKSMTILIDTREQEFQHIADYFDSKKIPYKKKALDFGDYSFMIPKNEELNIPRDVYFDKDIVVERKGSLEEISGNLTNGRDRLEKEFSLAPKSKVLLIENGTYEDIIMSNYKTKYNNKSFAASLHSFWHRYNIPVFFMPNNKFSGLFIRMYFEWYLRNYLR